MEQLAPGKHRYSFWRNEKVTTFITQDQEYICEIQEFSTLDNLTVRFSIHMRANITDVIAFRRALPEMTHEQYIRNVAIDSARAYVSNVSLDELLEHKLSLHERISNDVTKTLQQIGMSLIAVSPISILIPRSLRQAFEAELSVKKKAAADLEEARGRTAVLRHLANAATMVEKQPVLLQLLMGQKARQVQFQFDTTKKTE